MIANARMYSVTQGVASLWRQLLEGVIATSGLPVEVIDYPAPLPVAKLWARDDKAGIFMCGLPFSLATPAPVIVAAPVLLHGEATYWTDLIVAADSRFERTEDTFGARIAFTTPESQSGFGAPLHHLMAFGGDKPLYNAVVAPAITPNGAVLAVAEGRADVAPLDSYAHDLLRGHAPETAARVRVIARTRPTPIPPLVASSEAIAQPLAAALCDAHMDEQLAPVMKELLLQRFVRPLPQTYEVLRADFAAGLRFWAEHPLARVIDPGFSILQPEPVVSRG